MRGARKGVREVVRQGVPKGLRFCFKQVYCQQSRGNKFTCIYIYLCILIYKYIS